MNILKTTIFVAAALLLGSCADLDLDPLDTGSSDSWYQNEEEIKASISGLYRVDFFPIDGVKWNDDHQSRDRFQRRHSQRRDVGRVHTLAQRL